MHPVAGQISQHAQISWKTLSQYARAVDDFTRSAPPELPPSSFDRISKINWGELPRAKTFRLRDGVDMGYRAYRAAGSQRLLVLVHGSGCFGDQLHEIARGVSHRNIAEAYTLNMRGHGLSEGRPGHAVTDPVQMVADIAEFIGSLRAANPGCTVHLGGHSAGGGLVLAFSRSTARDLVDGYLFLAPFLGLGSPVNRPHFGAWVRLRGGRLRALTVANLLGIKRFNETTVVDFNVAASGGDNRYTPSWSFNTLLAFGPGRWLKDAPPIPADKPVLVLAGRGDQCFFHALYPEAFRVVAPHAEIPDVGAGGHWDLLVEPAAISQVGTWLSKHGAGKAKAPRKRSNPVQKLREAS